MLHMERSIMNFCQFIHAVEIKVKEGVQDNVIVYIHTAVKNNGTKRQGITITEKGINISPTIYLEEYYQQYQMGNSLEEITRDILKLYQELRFQNSWKGDFIREYQKIEGKIIYHLVNREANKELLKEVPYKEFLDLAVVFYVLLEINDCGMATMMIRDEHLQMWGVAENEVYEKACQNTWRLLPCEFQTMHAVIEALTGEKEMEGEDILYILSNQMRSYGAAAVLYEGRLKEIGRFLKENYYVLPSSVHEMIIVPESKAPGKEELAQLVKEINETQVEEEEVLSDNAYYYDRECGKLFL